MSTRITSRRADLLSERLSERDLEIVATLDKLRCATASQLERLHRSDSNPIANARQIRRILQKLVRLRVLTRLDRRIGGVRAGSSAYVYALDVAGQRVASASGPAGGFRLRRPWTPGYSFIAHRLAISELYVELVEAERSGSCELLAYDAEPLSWRRFPGPHGGYLTLKPDAFVRLGLGEFEDSYFVEIDRGTESLPAVARKLLAYRRHWQSGREQARLGVYPRVLIVVDAAARREAIKDVVRRQPADAQPLFEVLLTDAALSTLTAREAPA